MRKQLFFISIIIILLLVIPNVVHGATPEEIIGKVNPPPQVPGGDGATVLSSFIQRVIQLIYVIGIVGFLFMLLWSGLQLILNAGDKEATGNARKRIMTAIIGITLLALAFPIMRVLEEIIGIKFFS